MPGVKEALIYTGPYGSYRPIAAMGGTQIAIKSGYQSKPDS